MTSRINITGLGIISAIGNNVSENLESLLSQQHGISTVEHITTRHKQTAQFGEVKLSNDSLKKKLGLAESFKASRTSLLGMMASSEAMADAGIKNISEFLTGIISATSVGGMAMTEELYNDFLDVSKQGDFLEYIKKHECGESTEAIADYVGIRKYLTTISTACSSSANSIMFGARLIKNGILDRVLVGGTDSLSKFTINGFSTLMILDNEHCKPFDAERKGLNLGEGAGFIVLESEEASAGKKIYCSLSGYGNSNDAFHQTASSPTGEGAFKAMENALEVAGLKPNEIDYINAHGTGTTINDMSEGVAIERIFGNNVPDISSTKPFTGHTLGACGGIEAVFSVLAIHHNFIFPSLNFENQMPEIKFSPTKHLRKDKTIKNVLSNSFGFGGNTSSLIFSRI